MSNEFGDDDVFRLLADSIRKQDLVDSGRFRGKVLVDCDGTLSVREAAEQLNLPADELQQFLNDSAYPVMCRNHGYRFPESILPQVRANYDEWTVAMFVARLNEEL
jgi:hypothetical protein